MHERLLEHRITALEEQMKRLVSDAESEKETRRRANKSIEENFKNVNTRLVSIERTLWMALGVLLAVETILKILKG